MSEILYANLPQLVQQSNEDARACALLEDACVLLDNDDIQCGQIFFSESTRVLKYFCVFCKSTYDNINYYCDHLSTHINEDENENTQDVQETQEPQEAYTEEEAKESIETIVENSYYYGETPVRPESLQSIKNIDAAVPIKLEEKQMENIVESISNEAIQDAIHEDVTTHIVPTIIPEETYWNKPSLTVDDNKQIFCQQEVPIYEDPNTFDIAQNVETREVFEQSYPTTEDINHNTDGSTEESEAAMDFENMIAATNIRGNLNEVCKREKKKKSKKVTTVKVIAVRNRIAELYDKIKSEEEKRSQFNNFEAMQSETVNTIKHEEFISNDDFIEQSEENGPTTSVMQKVRGETVITLLPNNVQSEKTMLTNSYVDKSLQPIIDQSPSPKEGKSREKVCPACGMQFRSSFSLTIHKRTHYLESNSEVKLAHKCSDCNRLFNKISEMKVHLERDHYPDGFVCKICQKRLTSLTLLEKHMRLVHLNKPFSCKICQKSFETRTLFESHLDLHIEGRNYKCRICGRKYGTDQSLKHHMRRHKEQVPKCCVVCGKMTLRITQHMKIHTPRPKRVLSCSLCGKLFNLTSGLNQHLRIMHKQLRPLPKTKSEATTTIHPNSHTKANPRYKRRTTLIRNANDIKVEQEILLEPEQPDLHLLQHQQEHQHEVHEHILIDNEVQHEMQQDVHYTYTNSHQLQQQDVNEKEEEAKRVIVELIQNATYTSFLPDNHMNEFEVGPPIAREETISAVNSIVNDC